AVEGDLAGGDSEHAPGEMDAAVELDGRPDADAGGQDAGRAEPGKAVRLGEQKVASAVGSEAVGGDPAVQLHARPAPDDHSGPELSVAGETQVGCVDPFVGGDL